jgi:UMF1 family MFS transporter
MSDSPSVLNPRITGLELQADKKIPRSWVAAWAFWDWGGAAFNAVITTFVFTVYLTSTPAFGGKTDVTIALGWSTIVSGLVIALLAPVTGQRSDGRGRRKRSLGIYTSVVVIVSALLFFIRPDAGLLPVALVLLAVGTIFFELASVNYNAMLAQVSTPKNVGRISGFGWSMGYFGGIVLLLILYFGFIHPDVGLFGVTSTDGLSVRVSMLIAAVWTAVFALPVLLRVPELPAVEGIAVRPNFFRSYQLLWLDVKVLWRESRQTVMFLIASAVFRDGLTGVFMYGGVLAATVFGFSASSVIIFAIAANVVAGLSTVIVGRLDDRLGAKPVMVFAISGTIVAGLAVFFARDAGSSFFWIFGLLMCVFVGPAQSASRSFLTRVIPAGREGEVFGLYATTGKAASFLAPVFFTLFASIFHAPAFGILGIALVLIVGLALLLPVKSLSLGKKRV